MEVIGPQGEEKKKKENTPEDEIHDAFSSIDFGGFETPCSLDYGLDLDTPIDNPFAAQAWAEAANEKMRECDYATASKYYDEAIRLEPEHRLLFYNRGLVKMKWGEVDLEKRSQAFDDFERSIELGVDSAQVYINRGYCRSREEMTEEELLLAERDFDLAISRDSSSWYAYNNRSEIRLRRGNLEGALRDSDKVLRLGQRSARIFFHRGIILEKMERWEEAIVAYDASLERESFDIQVLYARACAKGNINDYQGMIDDFTTLIEAGYRNAKFFHGRGYAYCELGNKDAARQDFQEALRINPGYEDVKRSLAILESDQNT